MIEKLPWVTVYCHPNPEIRSFLTSIEISSYRVEIFAPTVSDTLEARLEALGTIGARVVRQVLAIPGVREIEIKPRELRVKKEIPASWDPIQQKIIHILNAVVRRKEMRVV